MKSKLSTFGSKVLLLRFKGDLLRDIFFNWRSFGFSVITPSQTRPPYDILTYTLCLHWCRFFFSSSFLTHSVHLPSAPPFSFTFHFDPSASTDLGLRQYGFFKYLSDRRNVFQQWGRKKFLPRNSAFTSFSSINAYCRANTFIAAFIHQVILSKFLQQTFKSRAF